MQNPKEKGSLNKRRLYAYILVCTLLSALIMAGTIYGDNPISDSSYYAGTQVKSASYIMFIEGSTYYALNGITGAIDYSGADAGALTQSANNALNASNGGIIFFKAGEYVFNVIVFISDHVHLWGEGWNKTVLKAGANLNTNMIAGDTAMSTQRDHDIGFHYLGFDGNTANQASPQNLLILSGLSYGIVEHCKFWNAGKHAVLWAGGVDAGARPQSSNFIYNIIDSSNAGKDNTDLLGFGFWDYGEIAHNYISGNRTSISYYNTLVSRAGMHMHVHHNTFVNLPNNAMSFEGTWYANVHHNTVLNTGIAGMTIGNNTVAFALNGYPAYNTFSNNFVNDTGGYIGIGLSSSYSKVTNNIVGFCGLDGIMTAGDYNEISHNHVYNNDQNNSGRAGIWAQGFYTKINYNVVWDDQAVTTQDYGIRTPSALTNYTTITHNYLNGSTYEILLSGSNIHYVKFNTGYVTENRGSITVSNGGVVAHGLEGIPTNIMITGGESQPQDIYVDGANVTHFIINFGGGGSKLFYWYAEFEP